MASLRPFPPFLCLPIAALLAATSAPGCGDSAPTTESATNTNTNTNPTTDTTEATDTASSTETTGSTTNTSINTTGTTTPTTTSPATTAGTTEPDPTTDGTTDPTDPTTTTDPTTDPTTGTDTGADELPPMGDAELEPWLEMGGYKEWPAESGPHDSAGPHFGTVRTFVNQTLFDSLEAGNPTHPEGSAAVKELYGGGMTVLGYAVEVKVQPDSDGGNGWYWYEKYNGNVFADGVGVALCYNCHSGGADYVLTPFPLQ